MNALVQHMIDQNRDEILERSLLHCHSPNLHSIMFVDKPEQRVRLFIADNSSVLWQNDPNLVAEGSKLSIAFHPHHCNITLHVVKGEIINWTAKRAGSGMILDRYLYDSKIIGGGSGFHHKGVDVLQTDMEDLLKAGQSAYMEANDIHTVAVPRGKISAWFVYEGKDDKDYKPFCWSNDDLNAMTLEGLYKRPDLADINELLRMAGLS